jgi:hypothetical protein
MSLLLLGGAKAQNRSKMRGFAAIFGGRLRRSTNENYRTFSTWLGVFCAQRASLSQIFRSKVALWRNFSALHGALGAILRYNCGRHGEKLGVAGGSALATAHEGWKDDSAKVNASAACDAYNSRATRFVRTVVAASCCAGWGIIASA